MIVQDLSSFQCIEMAVYDSADFTGGGAYDLMNGSSSYTYYTGNGFQEDIKILRIYNASSVPIVISYQQIVSSGTVVNVPNDYLPSDQGLLINLQANHADTASFGSGTLNGRAGQLVWGSATAGTGNVYIVGYR